MPSGHMSRHDISSHFSERERERSGKSLTMLGNELVPSGDMSSRCCNICCLQRPRSPALQHKGYHHREEHQPERCRRHARSCYSNKVSKIWYQQLQSYNIRWPKVLFEVAADLRNTVHKQKEHGSDIAT